MLGLERAEIKSYLTLNFTTHQRRHLSLYKQVLISIQSLILVDEPYFNGDDDMMG